MQAAKSQLMAPLAAPAAQHPQASSRASSPSSAADPSSKGTQPNTTAAAGGGGGGSGAAASAPPDSRAHPNTKAAGGGGSGAAAFAPPGPSPSLNAEASRSPLVPAPHPQPHLGAPTPLMPPPVPSSRPLLTVAAVEAVMAAIPPPPRYGLEDLDRRTVALSDGTVRTYFALPLEPPPQLRQPPPPLPPHLLAPPPPPPPLPRLVPDRWALSSPGLLPPVHAPAGALLPKPALKRKWEDQANGGAPVAFLGRQPPLLPKPDERRVAKQVKVEVPALDAKVLKSAFLKMVKVLNENEADKKNLRANGKLFQLKCSVCKRDSVDLHALLNHAYHAQSPEHRADHLGLHKALCVLMGWNYSIAPVHKNAYQSLSTADAEANQGDLILWPPTVIVENTYKSKNDGQRDGMSNNEMESKLREMGFSGVDVQPLLGKDGQRSMQVKFPATLDGLNKASQLVQLFENAGHGRAAWAHIRSIVSTVEGANNPMLVKVDGKGERTWVLYGYLATAWDLDILDAESKQRVIVKSRKELDLD